MGNTSGDAAANRPARILSAVSAAGAANTQPRRFAVARVLCIPPRLGTCDPRLAVQQVVGTAASYFAGMRSAGAGQSHTSAWSQHLSP